MRTCNIAVWIQLSVFLAAGGSELGRKNWLTIEDYASKIIMWRFFSPFFSRPTPTPTPPPKPEDDLPPAKVAIIGAGMGGCFAAKFLRENGGKKLDIHVFAKKGSEVGGRAGVCHYDGHLFESGALTIHPENKYLVDAAKEYDLSTKREGAVPYAFFDGKSLFHMRVNSIIQAVQLFWRYGFDLFKMNTFINGFAKDLNAIYPLQDSGTTYTNVEDMLIAMGGPQFCNLMNVSAYDYMHNDLRWNELLINEVVGAPVRLYYGQSTSVNATTAGVSLATISNGNRWRVVGGNYKIAENVLKASDYSSLTMEDVVSVTKVEGDGSVKYTVVTADGKTDEDYDVVIVANPLNTSSIRYNNFSSDVYTEAATTPYQRIVATFCKGKINQEFFGEKADSLSFPQSILNTNVDALPFNFGAVGAVEPADKYMTPIQDDPVKVWEVLSAEPLTREQRLSLFPEMDPDGAVSCDWQGFPQYIAPYQAPSFVLDDGVFYINAIEMAASTMELTAVSAKNAALLTREYLLRTSHED